MTENAESWTLGITLEHGPHRTRANAMLHTPDGHEFCGVGLAAAASPRVGDYLAIGRALSDLTQELVEAVAVDVETAATSEQGRGPLEQDAALRPGHDRERPARALRALPKIAQPALRDTLG